MTISFLAVFPVAAQETENLDCQSVPDCETLGFSVGYDDGCAEDGYVTCPFNDNYRKCVKHTCQSQGFTKDDKTAWCETITKCATDPTYTACAVIKFDCPSGYSSAYKTEDDCTDGLLDKFEKIEIAGGICGKCTYRSCASGYTLDLTLSQCGDGSWKIISQKGESRCKKCSPKNSCMNTTFSFNGWNIPYISDMPENNLCKTAHKGLYGTTEVQCYACIPCYFNLYKQFGGEAINVLVEKWGNRYTCDKSKPYATIFSSYFDQEYDINGFTGTCRLLECISTFDYDECISGSNPYNSHCGEIMDQTFDYYGLGDDWLLDYLGR